MATSSNLEQEIEQQPQVLQRLLTSERPIIQQLVTELHHRQISQIVMAARGSSDNAARYAQYVFGSLNGFLVSLATPSLYSIYQQTPQLKNTLVLGISQSGQSPDLVAVLAEARLQKVLTAAITNFSDSPLAQQADYVINLNAGVEKSIAATKTYTTELLAIALLSAELSQQSTILKTVQTVPELVQKTLTLNPEINHLVERYRYMKHCVVIGRGYNYATAFELALKLKELTYTLVEPYSSADFLHGPLAIVEPGFPVFVIAPSGKVLPEIQALMQTLKQREAELIVISDDQETLKFAQTSLILPPDIPEWISPLVAIIPGQLFALNLALTRHYNVDQPRGLQKVTETR
ncbi:Glutamine--fructose-6-phosphate aminotransferase [isomerizing] [Planktothrix tepida]|uniref:Glucosamine--fructose-6-phosphate aminotransferase-related protein n=1 Tax=Planktothrix tepida PCC 9214 TaxID=671072 RepID=A0A1J1LMP8_9CYAN|nr:SIS domain-containing protein [Planktothrix tepida]CAD5981575.1 Glutamine--fructose-6-phosphate aminotransferase [isomerizing] [Planktothrix tepida]CUR33816.1 Glucosamine--fructose-6-phosphate aminotransferase-related protein [Planktothrix tepida PCC 9214]